MFFILGAKSENNTAQQIADKENGAQTVQETETPTEETKEELEKETSETPQSGTETVEEEEDTNQIEVKTQMTNMEDECAQDDQMKGDNEDEDQKPEVKQDTVYVKERQTQEYNNFTNKENKSNENPELMEKPEYEKPPDGEVPTSEEAFDQKKTNKASSDNSLNDEETRATPMEEEIEKMEEISELQPENPGEISVDPETMDQNTEIEKVSNEGLSDGEEAEDKVTKKVRAEEEDTVDKAQSLQNNAEETGNDITECPVEDSMEDTELELKHSSVNEVIDEDVKSESVEKYNTMGEIEQGVSGNEVQTDVRDGKEEAKDQDPQVKEDQNPEEGKKYEEKNDEEITKDRAEQKHLTYSRQSSEEKAEAAMGAGEKKQEEHAAEKETELRDEQKSGSESKATEDDQHEEELKEIESLKEVEDEENKIQNMSEERTDVGNAEILKSVVEQDENNKEEQEDSDLTALQGLQETTDGLEVKSGQIDAENGEEIIILDQQELEKTEEVGPGEGEGTSGSNEEKIYRDITTEEGVKDDQVDNDNEKEEDQRKIQQETTKEEEEGQQKVSKEDVEQKQYVKQEITNEEDEQTEKIKDIKPLIPENSKYVATEDETSSDGKTQTEDPADAESESKNMNGVFQSRGEEESRAEDNNNIQSSTDTETKSIEGSSSASEESQPLEKVQALKKEEREAELIIAPRSNHEELVSNWVNVHQASNYFETFVEPLDEIKILDGERTVNAEALESPIESHGNEELSETAKDQISLSVKTEDQEAENMMVENINMETEALGAYGQMTPSSNNLSEKEESQRQMGSERISEDQEDAAENNVMSFSAAPLMKVEISQDS